MMGRTEQLEELDALQSIFYSDELVVLKKDGKDIKIIFLAHVTLPENFLVKYKESPEVDEYSFVDISYLPPIKLSLTLPEAYPNKCSPKFNISCQWLTKSTISKLCTQLDIIWSENEYMQIIYMWIDFLKNDLLDFLRIENELDLTELYFFHINYVKNTEQTLQYSTKQGYNMQESSSNFGNELEINTCEKNNDKYKDNYNTLFYKNGDKTFMCGAGRYYNSQHKGKEIDDELACKVQNECDPRACSDINLQTSPLKLIMNYNVERKKLEFNKKFFECSICLDVSNFKSIWSCLIKIVLI